MWPKKSKQEDRTFTYAGVPQALDGHAAVYAIETIASDVIILHAVADFAELCGPLRNLTSELNDWCLNDRLMIYQEERLEALAAKTSGYALTGLRSVAMTSSLRGIHEALYAMAGKRLACVINLTCRAVQRQGAPLHGGHDQYYDAAACGFVQLFASNVQEVTDFSLIAHRIAELALTPVICAQDFYHTSHSIQNILMPETELVNGYLGRSEDRVTSPTPSQVLLYGQQRRRIPLLVDRDHPAGIGGVQDQDSNLRAIAAQRAFFYDHCDALVDQAMHEYGELTGRFYNKISGYRVDDAELLVLAQGAVIEELRASVDYLRKQEKIKAGIVNLSVLRPFPGAQLAHILKGKKAVTVLERTDQPLAEDLPLMKEIRSAIDKAVENGQADKPSYPAHASYRRPADRPRLFSAIYGLGCTLPSARELLAVYRNMLAADGGNKRFYLDVNFGQLERRFPYLQTLQQSLNKDYPQLQHLSLSTNDMPSIPVPGTGAIQIHSLSSQGGLFAGNIFARALANALQWNIRTFPEGGLEQNMQAVTFSLLYTQENSLPAGRPENFDTILVSAYKLVENISMLSSINTGGHLIVESNRSPENLWHALPRQMQQLIQKRELRIFSIDAQGIAAQTASVPTFIDQLSVWSLLGACLQATAMLSTGDKVLFRSHLKDQLSQLFGMAHKLIDEILQSMDRGGEQLSELPWQSWLADKSPVVPEADPPWTAQQLTRWNNNVFDVTRFWHSVGFLYDSGQAEHTLCDPYLATGIVPAGSSAFRDISAYRLRIPEWLTEDCNACGLCWAQCPESALPASVLSLSSIIHNAVEECEQQGAILIQIKRIETQLAKQAYTLLNKDNINQYERMGLLLQDAFVLLCERIKIEGDKYEELKQEFDFIYSSLQNFKFAKTDTFFVDPHKQEKGSGQLLAIALNPMTCSGCGICVEVCPESAFAWREQTTELVQECRENWQLQMKLPGLSNDLMDKYIASTEPQAPLYRLLDKNAYHSMTGGDGTAPGNSVKTAVHLLTATIESVKKPQFQSHIEYLSRLIEQLEQKIQGKVADTLNINDFESFSRRISRLEEKDVSIEQLSDVIDNDGSGRTINQVQLQRLTNLLEQLKKQHQLYEEGAGGTGRARMLLSIDPAVSWSSAYPYNSQLQPWVSHLPGDAALLAEALLEGVMHGLAEEVKSCRLAELELNDAYNSEQHDTMFRAFSWRDFNQQERQLIPVMLVICEPGTSVWAHISRLLTTTYPIMIAMINNEGISIAPTGDGPSDEQLRPTHSGLGKQSDLLNLGLAHTTIIQTTVGHPINLVKGAVDALENDAPSLLHIYAPNASSSGSAMEKIIGHAALAGQSRAFPLFRITAQSSSTTLSIDANPDFEHDWSTSELEFSEPSGLKSSLAVPLTLAHWALGESRFRQHFTLLAKGHLNEQMKPLVEYIDLDPAQREDLHPYIDFSDENQRHMLAQVSEAMVEATQESRKFWRHLCELAGNASDIELELPIPTAEKPNQQENIVNIDSSAYQRVTDKLLQLCGFSQDPDFFKQSLREFITETEQDNEEE